MHYPGWTEARTEELKKLWAEGYSCSEIASRIGHCTRNSVIGKVHRLGLDGRRTTLRKKKLAKIARLPRPRAKPAKPLRTWANVPYEPFTPAPEQLAATKTIHELEFNDCRWPIGDPGEDGFGFCGREKHPGIAYCACHARIAFSDTSAAVNQRAKYNNVGRASLLRVLEFVSE